MSLQTCLGTLIIILENLSGVIGKMNGVIWNFLILDYKLYSIQFPDISPIYYLVDNIMELQKTK